jgi:3-hydroxy-9,10-secoandrosta-1,3,5(10)-triene-9,17-dione monooxygenase
MISGLRDRAPETEDNRGLLGDTISEFKRAGLARVLQPKRWGGHELSPQVQAEIAMALGEGDMCAGWVFILYSSHAFHLGFFDDRAQQDVWGANEDALIASSYSPSGNAEPVQGGYRVGGRWKYSSGSNDSDWVILGALASDRPMDGMCFLMPRSDYDVVDTWHTFGLKGTGSNDIVVNDMFVPTHRAYSFAEGFAGKHPGTNDGALYKIPFLQIFYRGISTAGIGALQQLYDAFIAYAPPKMGPFGTSMIADPDAQYAAGIAFNTLHEIKTLLRSDVSRLYDCAAAGEVPPMDERFALRYRAGHVAERCVEAARLMLEASGGSALYETHPFGRIYRNLTAARNHIGVQHRSFARSLGSHLFGIPNHDIQV